MTLFERIYEEFHPKIFRYLSSLCNEDDAADLTQSVFVKVNRALADFRGDSSLSTWIYRIATNTALDHAASSLSKQRGAEIFFDEDGSVDDLYDPQLPATDQRYIRYEMNACVRELVDQLPENYRTVLLMSDYEELTNQEIAEALDISLETVKIRLFRGRKHLKNSLECNCTFYHDERNTIMCDRI